jgi:type VI secretion system secreted protein Hcp
MAVDMFLKLDGIEGESQDKVHAKSIDVLAWSWGLSQSGCFHAGGGGGSGKANFQDISVTKYVDKSSMTLMGKIATGQHIEKAKLIVRKAGGTAPIEYVVIEMEKVMVTSLSTGGSGGEDKLTENISLNFAIAKVSYLPQKADGGADAAVEFKWDISQNTTA